jgi:predicted dehydrogenase
MPHPRLRFALIGTGDFGPYFDARQYDYHGWWTRHDRCGGTLAVIGVHIIDWMRGMCGDVVTVRGLAAPQVDSRYDFPDTLHVSL